MSKAKRTLWISGSLLAAFAAGFALRLWNRPSANDLLQQAQISLDLNDDHSCKQHLTRLLVSHPQQVSTQARLMLAKISNQQSDWNTVIAALRPVPDSDPLAATVRIAEGDAWRRLYRASEAEDCWERALAINADARQARSGLLYLYSVQLRRDLWLQKLWELYDRREAGERELIQLLIAAEVVWETKEILHDVAGYAAADPEDVHNHRALATYLLASGRAQEARKRLRELHERYPEDLEVWLALAAALLTVGDTDSAATLFQSPPPAATADYRYWKQLGSMHLLREQYGPSCEAYRKSVELFPYNLEVRNRFARALRFANQIDAAREQAQCAQDLSTIQRLCHTIDTNGWDLEKVRKLIYTCEKLRLIEEAIGWTRQALKRAPDDADLRKTEARLETLPLTSSRHLPKTGAI